jgi:hypothetical protein
VKRTAALAAIPALMALLASACGGGGEPEPAEDTTPGTLTILVNGEDFVQNGFVSKDGWSMSFRHLWVTLDNIEAHQTEPPFDPDADSHIAPLESVGLAGPITLDLASPDGPVTAGTIEGVPPGHYNAISWDVVPAASGPSEGYSLFIDGQAEKGDRSYQVYLGFERGLRFLGGEYVGDERLGFVEPGGGSSLEITFHMDHLFGDGSLPADDPLNASAIGFGPFASLMQEGVVSADLEELDAALGEDFGDGLTGILKTLGHTGEGHCLCIVL